MSADLLQFLKNKFMEELEEAEEEHLPPQDIPLHPCFQQIRQVLENYSITSSTPIRMKDCLYDLSIALTDCIIFLEKRKTKINKDSSQGQGQGQGHYSLSELWFLCKIKSKLIRIKKNLLVATRHPVQERTSLPAVTDIATTSFSSGSFSFDEPPRPLSRYPYFSTGLVEEAQKIAYLFWNTSELDGKGFSKEIGIVGIGGCGKTSLARMLFYRIDVTKIFRDSRIWINLQAIRKGEIEFKKILEAMLKQCNNGQRDLVDGSVKDEDLLEALRKALWKKSYLIVFDGVWDTNLDWYWRLKERVEWSHNKSNQKTRRGIIVTTRLNGVAKRMVGSNNLHHMQPLSNLDIWKLCRPRLLARDDHPFIVKMKDEIIYHSHGLPLSTMTLHTILLNHTIGGKYSVLTAHD